MSPRLWSNSVELSRIRRTRAFIPRFFPSRHIECRASGRGSRERPHRPIAAYQPFRHIGRIGRSVFLLFAQLVEVVGMHNSPERNGISLRYPDQLLANRRGSGEVPDLFKGLWLRHMCVVSAKTFWFAQYHCPIVEMERSRHQKEEWDSVHATKLPRWSSQVDSLKLSERHTDPPYEF